MKNNPIVSREEWLESRKRLLQKEKELTRLRDDLSAERRQLPWVRIDKPYVFEGPQGRRTLADLFDGSSQLMTYHFMLNPVWLQGCPSCSFLADHIDGALVHLKQRDVKVMAVSRAPYSQIAPFKRRMGWQFDWASSHGSEFNYDFQASHTPQDISNNTAYYNYDLLEYPAEETHGLSVFYKDAAGDVFHTYSSSPAALRCWSRHTSSSTWPRRGATKVSLSSPWPGFDITTATATLLIRASLTIFATRRPPDVPRMFRRGRVDCRRCQLRWRVDRVRRDSRSLAQEGEGGAAPPVDSREEGGLTLDQLHVMG